MKILNCHIENFGKLHNCTFDFEEQENILCRDNGWGKSTFAAFIRVMFYGLEGDRKRSLENERRRYMPWQGGVYGGQLTFETGGKAYVVSRVFRDKDANDEFELRDAVTNKISNDFSSNLGEELFRINRASFLRTVFISQSDCTTETTDDINAKIGNLSDNTNDMNNFESASKNLTDLLNQMTPKRSTGLIYKLSSEITAMEQEVKAGENIEESIDRYQALLAGQTRAMEREKGRLADVIAKQREVSGLQTALAKKENYEVLCRNQEKKKADLKEAGKYFAGAVPDKDEVSNQITNCRKMDEARSRVLLYRLEDSEQISLAKYAQLFWKETPSEEEIAEMLEDNRKLSQLRQEILMRNTVSAHGALALQQNAAKKFASILLMIGMVIAVLGLAICFVSRIPGVIVAAAGMVMAVVSLLLKQSIVLKSPRENSGEADTSSAVATANELSGKIRSFLGKYDWDGEESDFADALHGLSKDVSTYEKLQKQKQNHDDATDAFLKQKGDILDFLRKYNIPAEEPLMDRLLTINNAIIRYAEAEANYREAEEARKIFAQENDIAAINAALPKEELPSLVLLQEEQTRMSDRITQMNQAIAGYHRVIGDLQEKYDEWAEQKELLAAKKDQIAQMQQKYMHIDRVKTFLTEAKESLTMKYTAPVYNGFKEYYALLSGQDAENYHIDASTKITVDECGKQRETNALSVGYQDMIGFCLRIALVDTMYQKESPVLIMDDPFVNLDEEKAQAAMRLLKKVGEKYQIVYFTCHSSRS